MTMKIRMHTYVAGYTLLTNVSKRKPTSSLRPYPNMLFFSMNQLALSPVAICKVFCCAIKRIKNSTSAGASRFSAVPPTV